MLALLKHPPSAWASAWRAQRQLKCSNWRCCAVPGRWRGPAGPRADFDRFRADSESSAQGDLLASRLRAACKIEGRRTRSGPMTHRGVAEGTAATGDRGSSKPHDFAELAQRHRETLVLALLRSERRRCVFEDRQDPALSAAFDDLLSEQKPSGLMVQLGDYPEVFQTAFADRMVRRPEFSSTHLHIYGQLEARLTESRQRHPRRAGRGRGRPRARWIGHHCSRPMRHELGLDLRSGASAFPRTTSRNSDSTM